MKTYYNPSVFNNPITKWLKQMTIYFASYEVNQVHAYFHPEIEWHLVGDKPIIGKTSFVAALKAQAGNKVAILEISDIIIQGKSGAVHGQMQMEDGTTYGFADFYELDNVISKRIKRITSYVQNIRLNENK